MTNLRVIFGRENGEKTLGEIIKYNPTKAKVRTLEERGQNRPIGQTWTVPYSLMRTEDGQRVGPRGPIDATAPAAAPVVAIVDSGAATVPIAGFVPHLYDETEKSLIDALCSVYSNLSPENLACDGERPRSQQAILAREYNRQLQGIFMALNCRISETEAFDLREKYGKVRTNEHS